MSGPDPRLAASQRRIVSAPEARALVEDVVQSIDDLESVLAEETSLLKVGRVTQALDLAEVKSARSGHYLRLLEAVKANAIALARYAPDALGDLKQRHSLFTRTLALNETVIATVRAVSESLLRGLSDEASASSRLTTYGPGLRPGQPRRPSSAGPLTLSVKL